MEITSKCVCGWVMDFLCVDDFMLIYGIEQKR
jgi:hypothetical protein